MEELQRRLDVLERRPVPAITAPVSPPLAPAPAPSPVAFPNLVVSRELPRDLTIPRAMQQPGTDSPLDLAVLSALDGRRRRVRIVTGVVVLLVGIFASLFIMLAQSYAPPHP